MKYTYRTYIGLYMYNVSRYIYIGMPIFLVGGVLKIFYLYLYLHYLYFEKLIVRWSDLIVVTPIRSLRYKKVNNLQYVGCRYKYTYV